MRRKKTVSNFFEVPNEYRSTVAQCRQVDVPEQDGHKEGEKQYGPSRRD